MLLPGSNRLRPQVNAQSVTQRSKCCRYDAAIGLLRRYAGCTGLGPCGRLQSGGVMFDLFYQANLAILYPIVFAAIFMMAELGILLGRMFRETQSTELGTFTGASLGLLALLLGFSFSLALSRYDARRGWALEEANAISSTANFALMLPKQAQRPILGLLRQHVLIRRDLGIPYDPFKMNADIARSVAIQNTLWQQATQLSDDDTRSLAINRFINSLNEMNNIHERRLTALRYHVPYAVTFILMGVSMLVIGFTGYHVGITGARRHGSLLMMTLMVTAVIMLIVDLDRPARGLIQVPVTALEDALQGMPAQ
jgi:hypothetical protein